MTTPIIDPSTKKAIEEMNDWKRKIWAQTMGIYFDKTSMMFYINNQPKPTKWQRFKAWIKSKLK